MSGLTRNQEVQHAVKVCEKADSIQMRHLHAPDLCLPKWRKWEPRRFQVPMVARPCEFESHLLHD